jgi:hypothetical protein
MPGLASFLLVALNLAVNKPMNNRSNPLLSLRSAMCIVGISAGERFSCRGCLLAYQLLADNDLDLYYS